MTDNDIPALVEGIAFNDDEMTPTLLNPATGRIFVTNKSGQRIIELCDGQKIVGEIIRQVSEEFSGCSAETVRADLESFLSLAVAQGVVIWRTNSR